MTTIGLILEPLDTLFFRGGRPFGAGLPGESSLPSPQSLAGMLRTFLLDQENADFAAMRGKANVRDAFAAAGASWIADVHFRGPWIAEDFKEGPRPLVTLPADLRFANGQVIRLLPTMRSVAGWQPALPGMRPLWSFSERPSKVRPDLLDFEGLRAYLSNGKIDAQHARSYGDCVTFEDRTGIGIDPATYASMEGEIYSTRNLRLKSGTVFYAEADVPAAGIKHFDAPATVPWGGERHHAIMRKVAPVRWPEGAGTDRAALLLLSPAFFPGGWRPDTIPDGPLRGAAVEGPYSISGWDLARGGPKPTRFGVDAGSVYCVEGFTPATRYLGSDPEDTALGYGFFLKGAWNYAS
jgi:CRISPR-associated protein Cmr3